MIFNMVGGAGDSGDTFAMITINYPSGSTFTQATNTDGYEDISATQRLYYVKSPTSGTTQTCEFTITDGTQTKSKTVSGITIGAAQTITMSYAYYLYNEGMVSGIEWAHYGTTEGVIHSDYLEIKGHTSVNAGFQTIDIAIPDAYSTLNIDMTQVSFVNNTCLQNCQISSGSTAVVSFSKSFATNIRDTFQVSTSGLTAGNYKFVLCAGFSPQCKANIHKVWFS